ncbi:MAG TPA: PAS domain-containing protein [Sphingobacteriaceae bacterium]
MTFVQDTARSQYSFLQGGGEMGELTRAFNWEETSLGPPSEWPQSLCTALGIILHSAFPMFLLWGEDFICFYNDAYRPSLGINGKHPAVGKKGREVWKEIWDFSGRLWENVMNTGEQCWFEDQLVPIYRNGQLEDVYWTFSYSPVYGDSGQVDGVFVTCTETTEKVRNVNALVESERRFQNLIREAPLGIVVLSGREMIVQVANKAYGALINRDYQDVLGKPVFDLVPETERTFRGIIEQVMRTGNTTYYEAFPYYILVADEQRNGYLDLVYQPYREDDGEISGVMILCQDVTEQVTSRMQLQRSEQRIRSLIENAPFPIGVYTGREMTISLANQAIIDIWGKGPDVTGKRYCEVLPELATQTVFEQLDEVYTRGTPFNAVNQHLKLMKNGELRSYYFNYTFTPLYDSGGQVYGVMNTAADVTEQVLALKKVERSEAELLETKQRLETELLAGQQLQQQKDDFIGIASHELKTPLATLKGSMQLLSRRVRDIEGLEKVENLIRLSNNSINKLSHLLEELLNDTKISEGQLQLKKSSFKVSEIIDDCRRMVDIIGSHQLDPLGDLETTVFADKQRIEQALINLVNNAMKYAPQSKSIQIQVEHTGSETTISVQDQGPGIPAEKLPHLFKRYYRVDTGGIQFSGLGLGLFIVSEIIQRHQGRLGVESTIDQGSRFWFTIPAGDGTG